MKKSAFNKTKLMLGIEAALYVPHSNFARCVDGRNRAIEGTFLPPVAMPGADPGETAIIFATTNRLRISVDKEKTFQSQAEHIRGEKNLRYHSDSHANLENPMDGCKHMDSINQNPEKFDLARAQVDFIMWRYKNSKAKQIVLEGKHKERLVLKIRGPFAVPNQFEYDGENIDALVFHEDFVMQRQVELAPMLVRNGAVILSERMTAENLADELSKTAEEHLGLISPVVAFGKEVFRAEIHPSRRIHLVSLGFI